MSGYVIERTDQGGGYVADANSTGGSSYTLDVKLARRFSTYEKAKAESCQGNERVVPLDSLIRPAE